MKKQTLPEIEVVIKRVKNTKQNGSIYISEFRKHYCI
jgi:hypothetical protein